MTVYVFRDGALRPKEEVDRFNSSKRSAFPAPRVSRIEPFASPVTGKEITSWRERDRDMAAVDAVDPRDLPLPAKGRAAQQRKAKNVRSKSADDTFKWTGSS